jgi:hypothetical protein
MARGKGFQGIIGFVPGVTWGTAVEANASRGILAASLESPGNTEHIMNRSITGRVTRRESRAGNRVVDVTLTVDLRYEGVEPLIAFALGLAGTPATVDVTAKQHVLKIKESLDGIFSCLAYELIKDTKVIEIPSVKWTGLTLRIKQGASPELEIRGIGFDWKDSSSINTTTTIDTVTVPGIDEYAIFSQVAYLMNAQGGAALAAGDAVHVSELELAVERAMRRIFSTQFGDKTSEPTEQEFLKVSGSLKFEELKDGTGGSVPFMAEQMSLTRKKATVTITSPTLAGAATQPYQHKLWLPNLQFGAGKPGISGPDTIQWTLPFEAFHVTTIPTGFPAGYDGALTWEVFSQRAGDALL